MTFRIFGKVSFTPATKVEWFADALRDGKIVGTACRACGEVFFPPRADCTNCLASDMERREVSGKGRLVTFTWIHAAPTGFEDIAPYGIGVIALEGGGRLLAWTEGIPLEGLKVGMELRAVPKILEDVEELKVVYVLRK